MVYSPVRKPGQRAILITEEVMSLKNGYCRTDTDGLVYKREDTHWVVFPDHNTGDPGVLDAKPGAIHCEQQEYEE